VSEVAKNIVAGIILILVLFWLMNPRSQAPSVIAAISTGTIGTIQALQGYSPRGGGEFYGGGGV
jgi:hypothetical protein